MNQTSKTPHDREPTEDTGTGNAVGVDKAAHQTRGIDVTHTPVADQNNGAQSVDLAFMEHPNGEGGGNGTAGDGVEAMDPLDCTRADMGQSPEFAGIYCMVHIGKKSLMQVKPEKEELHLNQ